MDPQVQASFIPKKPLDTGATRARSGGGLLFFLALFIFIVSLAAAGGVVLYSQYLNQSLASKTDSLNKAQGAYDPAVIADLVRMDSRINQAQTLLRKHVAASAIFSYLSLHTLANVSFSSFEYGLTSGGGATIKLAGQAASFSTVALQSDEFGAGKVLKDVVFSGISVGDKGSISFDVTATVDPSLLQYASTLGISPVDVPAVPSSASSTTQ